MAERPLGRGNAWAFRGTRFRRYACPITGYCSFMAIAINLMGSVPAFSILNAATTRARPKSLFATMVRQPIWDIPRSEEHTSELQSREKLVCRLLLEKKKR